MRQDLLRKASSEECEEADRYVSLMFLKQTNKPLQPALELLSEKYSRELYGHELINQCYRCHNLGLVEAYNNFRKKRDPELNEPQVSNFYDNNSFVDLRVIGQCLKRVEPTYPWRHFSPVPKNLLEILDGLLMLYGYIPNLERFLLYYPTYLEKQVSLEIQLFESGKIDHKIGYFLGFCGAAELGCVYIMSRMLKKFVKAGGDLEWIEKGAYPMKLRKVLMVNRILARSVWEISPELISEIVENPQVTHNELSLFVQILAFAHQQSTIALAMGLVTEASKKELAMFRMDVILQLKEKFDYELFMSCEVAKGSPSKEDSSSGDEYEQNDSPITRKKEPYVEGTKSTTTTTTTTTNHTNTNTKMIIMSPHPIRTNYRERKYRKNIRRRELHEKDVCTIMTVIGNELSKQEMYKEIHKLCEPLLPPYVQVEKRRENIYPLIDFSVSGG